MGGRIPLWLIGILAGILVIVLIGFFFLRFLLRPRFLLVAKKLPYTMIRDRQCKEYYTKLKQNSEKKEIR